jgi:hypothetical protein
MNERLLDIIENLEDAAERQYDEAIQSDGLFKCVCGRVFDPESEGGPISPNPWAMPVCGTCLVEAINQQKK